MKMKPLVVEDAAGKNRAASTLKQLVKNNPADPIQQTRQFLIERLGYTEERADLLLAQYS